MRLRLGPRRSSAEAGVSVVLYGASRLVRLLSAPFLLTALAATLLAGCDPMPLPDVALLQPHPPPRCSAKADAGSRKQPAPSGAPAKAAEADDATLRKLDYEAQCYRHAEMIARNRLGRLQESVQDMVKSARAAPSAARPSAAGLPY